MKKPAPLCEHCEDRIATHPYGLCQGCAAQNCVRVLYRPQAHHTPEFIARLRLYRSRAMREEPICQGEGPPPVNTPIRDSGTIDKPFALRFKRRKKTHAARPETARTTSTLAPDAGLDHQRNEETPLADDPPRDSQVGKDELRRASA